MITEEFLKCQNFDTLKKILQVIEKCDLIEQKMYIKCLLKDDKISQEIIKLRKESVAINNILRKVLNDETRKINGDKETNGLHRGYC